MVVEQSLEEREARADLESGQHAECDLRWWGKHGQLWRACSRGGMLSSVGELVVGIDDIFPERDWNADSWEKVSR